MDINHAIKLIILVLAIINIHLMVSNDSHNLFTIIKIINSYNGFF